MVRNLVLALAMFAGPALFAQAPVGVRVDATDAPRRLFHVQMTMPAKAGAMTLVYPQWIPGEHGPTGPITNLVGLKIRGGGQSIPWKRDSVNMFAFHIDVPSGVSSLDVAFDFISPPEEGGFTSGSSPLLSSPCSTGINCSSIRRAPTPIAFQLHASLKVPNGWKYGTALPIRRGPAMKSNSSPRRSPPCWIRPFSRAHYRPSTSQRGRPAALSPLRRR